MLFGHVIFHQIGLLDRQQDGLGPAFTSFHHDILLRGVIKAGAQLVLRAVIILVDDSNPIAHQESLFFEGGTAGKEKKAMARGHAYNEIVGDERHATRGDDGGFAGEEVETDGSRRLVGGEW